LICSYTHEPGLYGELIAQERNGEIRYYNYDGLGNTSELTDENENVTDTYEYSAFGEEVAHTGTTENPFGYKGVLGYYANPETNDIYVRARIYEPTIGRWLSRDPLGVQGEPTLNIFLYVRNQVVDFADPSGLKKLRRRCRHGGVWIRPCYPSRPKPSPISIKVVTAPHATGKCGGALYEVDFDVPAVDKSQFDSANSTGWIVQSVNRVADVRTCGGATRADAENTPLQFYEAFGPVQELPKTDTYLVPDEGEGTYGVVQITGRARWLPNLDVFAERVPTGKWSIVPVFGPADPGHVPEAQFAPTHPYDSPPNGWGAAGPSVPHDLRVEWNCCCGRRKETTVVATPSS